MVTLTFCNWMIENSGELIAALIGATATIIAVVLTIRMESKQRRKDDITKAKPILINYFSIDKISQQKLPRYIFQSESDDTEKIYGSFKNTDNAIIFIDYIKTETKIYTNNRSVAIDKNIVFLLAIRGLKGETLKECKIYCHDIYGNKYLYNAEFRNEPEKYSKLSLVDNEPKIIKTS